MGNKKEYNQYLWAPEQPRVYDASPLAISGTPMSEEDAAMSLKAENLQQSLQQNPIFKSAKQWEEQQKQREKEIAASKKWLELHPEDESDSPYTILERGKHQAIVNGKDPSYYEKMINDGEQFTKGALSVLSLPYLGPAAAGAYGYGASLVARGLFAGQGIYGLANENGVRKTVNLIKSGDYGRAALSGAGDVLNASMILPGAKFLGNVAKYGLKSTAAGEVLRQNVRYAPQIGRRLVVSKDYFKDPTKFYRIGTTPEKLSMEYAGENIVSGSAESLGKVTPADAFRRTVTRNSRIQPGKGANEGYWVLAPEQSNTKVTNLLQKVNSSHGGETQASAGTLWEGGLNSDSRFPSVIFEGTMPETVRASWNSTLGKSIGRSNFIRQPSENLPIGTRLGFKTGEIPIHSTSSFVETSPGSGKFFYNGEIIPENRIFSPQQFSKSNGKTYLGLIERPSKLSEAERLGIPKGDRGNLSQDQLDALEDLASYMQSGRYKNKFIIDQSGNFAWKSNLGSEDTLVPRAFADAKGDFGTRWARASTKEGTFKYIEDQDYGAPINGGFTAAFPNPDGMKWGPGELTSIPESKHSINIIMTSPKVDAIDAGLEDPIVQSLSNTIDPGIVKNWWIRTKQMSRPGSYLSGDAGKFPIGFKLLQDVDNHKFGNIANDLLYPDITNAVRRQGLSPDSYASIVKQGLRDGNSLRFGGPFFKWNPSAIKNKYIYDAFTQYKKGEISIDQYKETVDNWLKSMGVNKQSFIKNDQLMIPHPFVYYNKQGGILKRVEKAQNGMSVINPQIVANTVSKGLEVLGNLYDKYRTGKYTRPIYEFFNGKDADLSQEEYFAKHGYRKPNQDSGPWGLVSNIGAASKIISGAGKIIDLNKITKANLTLSEPEKYITLMHGTAPTHIPSIMSKGFEVPGGNILNTATLEVGPTPKRIFDFFNGKGGVGQANSGAAAIIRIPISELPGLKSGRKVADAIDDVFMGEDAVTRIPAKYITGFYKTQMKKQGGILKRVESGKSGIHIKPENRGKLTRLKKRTGKSESELWKEGNPAVRKMITFARNARKWKH